jgi:Uma2 family endonuclease
MTTTEIKTVFTPEDLLNLPDAVNYELANGNLVERHMGSESSAIAVAVTVALANFIRSHKLGHLFTTDCGYRCFPDDPDKVRKPDVSFVRSGRLPGNRPPEGYIQIAPDLVVEVLSPGDLAYEIDQKVAEYIAAGVHLVWVVNPRTRTVRIHRPDNSPNGPIGTAGEGDSISGETVLPGFECAVDEFFQI